MAEQAEGTEAPKKSKKTLIIAAVVMIIGLGAGGFFYISGKSADAAACETTAVHEDEETTAKSAAKKTTTTAAHAEDEAGDETHATESEECATEEKVEEEAHGPIVRLLPITMNLSDGHVLKVGLALQLAAEPEDKHLAAVVAAASGGGGHGAAASTEPSASPLGGAEAKALDTAIHYLGDSTYEALSHPGGRALAKEELGKKIKAVFHGDITEVYFTDFVMS